MWLKWGNFYTRLTYAHLVRIKALCRQGCGVYHILLLRRLLGCYGGLAFGGLETACQCVATTYTSAAVSIRVIRRKPLTVPRLFPEGLLRLLPAQRRL